LRGFGIELELPLKEWPAGLDQSCFRLRALTRNELENPHPNAMAAPSSESVLIHTSKLVEVGMMASSLMRSSDLK
jgi:hypothetical protein